MYFNAAVPNLPKSLWGAVQVSQVWPRFRKRINPGPDRDTTFSWAQDKALQDIDKETKVDINLVCICLSVKETIQNSY